ncbi:MAG: Asp-tRNA(Asn)/Glu-tRNA(Gln) amidotransferase subunit GatB, partial [Ruminiclostridium sp.]|nr:Asp-tRNA(Asn)/Glu-tRNA(Gln) amidotransferase subunit GatB [Ruminiclostridium sp.]
MAQFIPTIGLEIHAELLTKSKVFCTCSAAFGGEPNSRCCPVCSGLPGTLPVLNQTAVEYIVKAGYVTNCEISRFTKWDRKNYFYPDLPKAYQISQMPRPVCLSGYVDIATPQGEKRIRINRIHLEEDAGKLVHDDTARVSLADYNRCGIPLIETVTEPDFHSAEEVVAFVEKLRLLYKYAGSGDGRMEQGSLRCDVNISLAEKGAEKLGTRAELKNLNSMRSIARAIEYEIYRQSEILESGGTVEQETRRFSDSTGETSSLRSKEDAQDYRYFPDPDIPPIIFTEEELTAIRESIPELPEARKARYLSEGMKETDADTLIADKDICDFYEDVLKTYNNPKSVLSFMLGEFLRRINLGEMSMDTLKVSADEVGRLLQYGDTDKINKNNYKNIFKTMLETGKTPEAVCDEADYWVKEDSGLLESVIDELIKNNPKPAEQY